MDRPCIVCEENCPVSPKAIYTQQFFSTIRNGVLTINKFTGNIIEVYENIMPDKFAGGDYYCTIGGQRWKITANTENSIEISFDRGIEKIPAVGSKIEVQVRLQRPYVDIERCIGCGICEHECPVSGKKAIMVSAEGESRSANRKILLKR
jgi:NAD-dependent dihydropyrimidine dehydrogenase PreA subunit